MSSSKPLMLLLGAGANIGEAVAKKFASSGFNVATAARSLDNSHVSPGRWTYKIDLNKPEDVTNLFTKVSSEVGIPNVVIYNAAALAFPPDGHPLSVPVADIEGSLKINTISMYAAAQQAIAGFEKLPKSILKTFLYTGNMLNTTSMPMLISLGIGKSASAHIIQSAALAYSDKDYQFYYVDERKEDGSPMGTAVNGHAHAEHFFNLAGQEKQGPWDSTFVEGKGYVKFD
ncbi:putative short chain type dehydrogenase [Rhexocercosporidium sp. MPI-PUGE-AT-0058]|nr:putative short chain type dehydrogenase [Rhexocercosporidium sp. MPI-PUGE-AT-0058]